VKELCKKMGGDIQVYSQINKGTTFVMYIPFTKAAQFVDAPMSTNNAVRALLVDDMKFNNDLHGAMLNKLGVKSTLVCNGQEAYDTYVKATPGYFSFVFMDLQMPVMDGKTAVKLIRKFEVENSRKEIDIYIISGNSLDDDITECVNPMGLIRATKFFRKPISISNIANLLKKYSIRDALLQGSQEHQFLQKSKENNSQAHQKEEKGSTSSKLVLMVDDDQFSLAMFKKFMESGGHRVETCSNGQEAVEMVTKHRNEIGVIFMDCEMPVMNGYEATKSIREYCKEYGLSHLGIVGVSGHSDKFHRELCITAGMNEVFVKPMSQKEMFEIIRKYS